MKRAFSVFALLAVLLFAVGFQFDRLRIGAVGGADPLPTRIFKLTGTVSRSGNEATYTPPVTSVAGTANQVTVTPAAGVYTVGLDESIARTIQVPLSAANIIAMGTTPVELIAAPAAGKLILVESITFKMVRTATAFTGGGAVEFRYTNASGAKVSADIAASVVTTGGAGTEYNHVGGVIASFTPVAAAAIVIRNATAAFADGTGTAVVTIKYRIIAP